MRLKTKKVTLDRNENLPGFLFILPSFLGFLVFVAFPVVASLLMSVIEWDFSGGFSSMKFVGVANYINLIDDEWFLKSLKNTIIFTVTTVPISLVLGLIFAVMLDRFVYFRNFLKVSIFMPYISSVVASAIIWMVILHPSYGPVNQFLTAIGVENPPKWFADVNWAFPAIIMFTIWQQLGYQILVYMSGLKGVPSELYEASQIDGANEIQKFFYITVPMVSPTTFFLAIMGIIGSFKVFDQISVLTQGGPGDSSTVIAFYIYREAFQYFRMGMASAAAWVMFILVFIVTIIQWGNQKKWVSY